MWPKVLNMARELKRCQLLRFTIWVNSYIGRLLVRISVCAISIAYFLANNLIALFKDFQFKSWNASKKQLLDVLLRKKTKSDDNFIWNQKDKEVFFDNLKKIKKISHFESRHEALYILWRDPKSNGFYFSNGMTHSNARTMMAV